MRLRSQLLLSALCGLALIGTPSSIPAQEKNHKHPANRLAGETSPYLLQHAFNPVDWYPWGEEAFQAARESNKPIFLSIGYATCHWCHVMERESFEDETIAAYLNANYICVKVDREERPDVDQIYMNYQVAASGSGGWPLNVWLTPDLDPFFAGTYFPPEDKGGRPGFLTLATKIRSSWDENGEAIRKGSADTAQRLEELLQSEGEGVPGDVGAAQIDAATGSLAERFDSAFGGFGPAPKFPQPIQIQHLIQFSADRKKEDNAAAEQARKAALEMAVVTLENLQDGGIHDQIGGGFHRYSVDRIWRVPHFEKMLYDQAQLASAYLDAYVATGDPDFAATARGIFDYVERRLTREGGGFYSAEDADSYEKQGDAEKREGAFFVWSESEFIATVGEENSELLKAAFGIDSRGNAPPESDPHHELTGKNVLHRGTTRADLGSRFSKTPEEIEKIIGTAKTQLFNDRSSRIRPIRDDKVLTSWNGMMISAFARGYQVLGDDRYLDQAHAAADFLLSHLYQNPDGERRLLRSWRGVASNIDAFAEDYAYFVEGLLDLYECDFRPDRLATAIQLQEDMITHFHDTDRGGFYDARPAPDLIMRLKTQDDGTSPSANSTAARNLVRLAKMLGREDFAEVAKGTIASASSLATQSPQAVLKLLDAVRMLESGGLQLVVAGELEDPVTAEILREIHRRPQRNRVVLLADAAEGQALLAKSNEALGAMSAHGGKPTLYLCIDFACRLPTSDLDEIRTQFDEVLGEVITPE